MRSTGELGTVLSVLSTRMAFELVHEHVPLLGVLRLLTSMHRGHPDETRQHVRPEDISIALAPITRGPALPMLLFRGVSFLEGPNHGRDGGGIGSQIMEPNLLLILITQRPSRKSHGIAMAFIGRGER